MKDETIVPYSDRVVARRIEVVFKSAGGIYLGEIDNERETAYGKVVAVGPGKQVDSQGTIPMRTEVGDIVVYNARMPLRVNVKGIQYDVINESNILINLKDKDIEEKEFVSEGKEYEELKTKARIFD